MNHRRLNTGRMERNGIAFGEGLFISSPPSRSRIGGRAHRAFRSESGFGGWVDEKIKTVREAVPYHCQTIPQSTEPKKSHPQHLTIARTAGIGRSVFTWFIAWPAIGGRGILVYFERRRTTQPLMRTMLVIPIDVTNDLLPHPHDVHGHEDVPEVFIFHGTYEALDHGDATVLTDDPEARGNVISFTPAFRRPDSRTGRLCRR